MKRSKQVSEASELPRGRSPFRKMHTARKSGIPRSPAGHSGSGHSDARRIYPPAVKHSPQARVKHLNSPHLHSFSTPCRPSLHRSDVSMGIHRHLSNKKSHEVIKRRHSRSPINRGLSARHALKAVSRHSPDNYHASRTRESLPDYSSSPKKKIHREPSRYAVDRSPLDISLSRASTHHQSENLLSHRKDSSSQSRTRVPVFPHSHDTGDYVVHPSANRSNSSLIHIQEKSNIGYVHNRPEDQRIDHLTRYMEVSSRKQFGPTLDERFSNEARQPMEPRVRYTRADLEKITIDIRPTLRELSPTIRRIMNPNEIKLVRRPSEGKRPIFDRQEIKQAPKDLREDARFEQKDISFIFSDLTQFGMSRRYLENYEVTRHKFDNYHIPSGSVEIRTLNDRWQKIDDRKEEFVNMSRDGRSEYNGRSQHTCNFIDDNRSLHQTFDRDYCENRTTSSSRLPCQRTEYVDSNRPYSGGATDFRESLSVCRKDELISVSRDRTLHRREDKSTVMHDTHPSWLMMSKGITDNISDRMRSKRSSSRGSRAPSPRWESERGNSKGNPRNDKLPDFSQRPDRYKYQPWLEKPDVIPKSPTYYEHDDRYSSEASHLRMLSRPYRGRMFRSRPFRTNSRGGMRGRGIYRGYSGSSSPRGIGYKSRRGRFSPSHWEHDMFEKSSQDHKHMA